MILLDMDEVLVDFIGPWLQALRPNLTYDSVMDGEWGKAGNLQQLLGIPDPEFWEMTNKLGVDWWANLPWTPWGQELLHYVQDSGEDWTLCSSPGESPDAAAGKMKWVNTHLKGYSKLILTNEKHVVARPDYFLIDDMPANTKAFTAAGGQAVLIPRPWNTTEPCHDPMSLIRKKLPYDAGITFTTERAERAERAAWLDGFKP